VQSTPIYPFEQDDEDGVLVVVPTVQVFIGENFRDVEKTKRYEDVGVSVFGVALLNTSEEERNPSTTAVAPGVVVA